MAFSSYVAQMGIGSQLAVEVLRKVERQTHTFRSGVVFKQPSPAIPFPMSLAPPWHPCSLYPP